MQHWLHCGQARADHTNSGLNGSPDPARGDEGFQPVSNIFVGACTEGPKSYCTCKICIGTCIVKFHHSFKSNTTDDDIATNFSMIQDSKFACTYNPPNMKILKIASFWAISSCNPQTSRIGRMRKRTSRTIFGMALPRKNVFLLRQCPPIMRGCHVF